MIYFCPPLMMLNYKNAGSLRNTKGTRSKSLLGAPGAEWCSCKWVIHGTSCYGPCMEWSHSHRAHSGLLPHPRHDFVHCHRLLQHRCLWGPEGSPCVQGTVRGRLWDSGVLSSYKGSLEEHIGGLRGRRVQDELVPFGRSFFERSQLKNISTYLGEV